GAGHDGGEIQDFHSIEWKRHRLFSRGDMACYREARFYLLCARRIETAANSPDNGRQQGEK
ncbi:MAG: hypothetical protein K8S22_02555, partial [Betaproteobacteria bacterium]|nr:hypothetical protein [Betaproteobacteria bacterium]